MSNLHEVLEICLNEIEQGADVETVLFRYPEFADELRPMVEASVSAKEMAVPMPSQEIIKRNRARILQHASEMREQSTASSRRIWSVPLRRALVTLMVVAMLFVSSTELVRASSNTLPGDNLYPVKRTWEDVSLFFTFDAAKREELELDHENERLDELHELFAEGRSANVDFAGYVTNQNGTEWQVSGITVLISPETYLPSQRVELNAAVQVKGQAQRDMNVLAERIELLPSGTKLPELEDNEDNGLENDNEEHEGSNLQAVENAGDGSVMEPTIVPATQTPVLTVESKPETESFDGVVNSIDNEFIVVNGTSIDIGHAEIIGDLNVGVSVNAEGYYDANGVFVATKITFKSADSTSGSESSDNNTSNNSNDDSDHIDDHSDDH